MEMQWIRSHAAAQFEALPISAPDVGGKTIRAEVTLGLGGSAVRLVLGQQYGNTITYGSVKLAADGLVFPVTFGGSTRITLEKGQRIISDPVTATVSPGSKVTLWFYIETPGRAKTASIVLSRHSSPGDYTGTDFSPEPSNSIFGNDEQLPGYCGIDVLTLPPKQVIAVLGDSITAMELWTKPVQQRLIEAGGESVLLNLGISGERLLLPTNIPAFGNAQYFGDSGLERLDREILSIPGLTAVAVALGVNDISQPGGEKLTSPPAEERCTTESLIEGFRQVINRCRQSGLKVYGCTITPFGNYLTGNPETCCIRNEVNEWMRRSKAFDGVIDFAALSGNPQNPDCYAPEFDSGDHLHPSTFGGKAMAEAFLAAIHF